MLYLPTRHIGRFFVPGQHIAGLVSPIVSVAVGDGPAQNILTPITAATFLSVTSRNATHIYSCQEASGNALDLVGSMNLTAAGTPLYQQSITGWTRKGFTFTGSNGQRFSVNAGTGPNPTLTPVAMLIYCTIRTGVGSNSIFQIADTGGVISTYVQEGAGVLRTTCGAAATNVGVTDHRDTLVHPILFTFDLGNTSVNRYSNLERDDGTFGTGVVDGQKGMGGTSSGQRSYNGEALYFVIMEGADAQFTALQAKTFLQSLGWTIGWAAP